MAMTRCQTPGCSNPFHRETITGTKVCQPCYLGHASRALRGLPTFDPRDTPCGGCGTLVPFRIPSGESVAVDDAGRRWHIPCRLAHQEPKQFAAPNARTLRVLLSPKPAAEQIEIDFAVMGEVPTSTTPTAPTASAAPAPPAPTTVTPVEDLATRQPLPPVRTSGIRQGEETAPALVSLGHQTAEAMFGDAPARFAQDFRAARRTVRMVHEAFARGDFRPSVLHLVDAARGQFRDLKARCVPLGRDGADVALAVGAFEKSLVPHRSRMARARHAEELFEDAKARAQETLRYVKSALWSHDVVLREAQSVQSRFDAAKTTAADAGLNLSFIHEAENLFWEQIRAWNATAQPGAPARR